jgi:broad specificity phosphatase PhoE
MRITLVRHGQSEGNTGIHDYAAVGDHKVVLTQTGNEQAYLAGQQLSNILNRTTEDNTLIYCSPYTRTRQTLAGMFHGAGILPEDHPRVFEDPRLRETEHGYTDATDQKPMRAIHGWFYYRYAGGESPADCSDRISTFLESMMRQVQRKKPQNVIIVTHGLSMRCFVMRFLHLTVEQFETLANPGNCDIITIGPSEYIENPVFTSGRWAVEGIKLREPDPALT